MISKLDNVLPQKAPARCLDSFISNDGEGGTGSWKIPVDSPFTSQNTVTNAGLLEHAAQCCAARLGMLSTHEKPQIGFLVSIRNLVIDHRPGTGILILTQVRLVRRLGDMAIFDTITRCAGEEVIRSRLQVMSGRM